MPFGSFPRDLAAHLLVAALLFAIARGLVPYLLAIAMLLAALGLSNAGKIAFWGGPIMPDDFVAVRNLFLLLEGWQLVAAVAVVAVPSVLLALMIAWHHPRSWVVVGLLALVVTGVLAFPVKVVEAMDRWFGNVVWNQRGNFERRGLLIHLLQEGARHAARASRPPGAAEVDAALATLRATATRPVVAGAADARSQRNVHMIVLESFWDPTELTANRLSADPVDPEFRALWSAAGRSQALSPVFGGYTANAEFEALCGFPVTQDSVYFEGGLLRDVPCLPRHLAALGYRTIASHPNIAAFWNRVNAYRRIGFDTYWSDRDFVRDDMNREFLSDASMYRQVLAKIDPLLAERQPIFNYVLTFFGHLDYPLSADRPHRIETRGDNALVQNYVNTIYYKSRELMAFLKVLRARDPDALIVLFGDHLPFLGPNFAGFTDSNLLADNRSRFDARMFRTLTATPLVVIDGHRGPVDVGELSVYQFPRLILELLGDQRPSLMRLSATPDGTTLRPLPGVHLVGDGASRRLCRDDRGDDDGCTASRRWLDAIALLTRDLFNGDQHALRAAEGSHYATR